MSLTARLDAYLASNDLDAVWFARPGSFAWLTGGADASGAESGDNVVDRGGDIGVAAAGYDGDGVTVVTDNIEAPRLREEELGDGVDIETFPWYDGSLAATVAAVSPSPAAADFDVPGLESLDATPLRQPLTDRQQARYRDFATGVAEAGPLTPARRSSSSAAASALSGTATTRRKQRRWTSTPCSR